MNDTNPAALPETGRPLTAREFFSLLPVGAPPYIPEVDDNDDEDTTGLTPEREQEIRDREQAATPGPWEEHAEYGEHFYAFLGGSYLRGVGTLNFGDGEDAEADQAFTLHARQDIPALLAELNRVRAESSARIAKLEAALEATGRSLSAFIFDSEDPGTEALGAQWLYWQTHPQADDPFAQPHAFRSSVFIEASKAAGELDTLGPELAGRSSQYCEGHSDGLQAAVERLEKLADQAAEGSHPTPCRWPASPDCLCGPSDVPRATDPAVPAE